MTDNQQTSRQVSPEELTARTDVADQHPGWADLGSLRVLITNDDGIESEGLRRLALVAAEAGMRVTVAAPLRESSGASAAITATEEGGRFVVEERSLPGLEEHDVFGVGALPAFITLVAMRGAFGDPPDLVLSGINNGPNTGHAILHSGTVGAALTAAAHHTSALAVSLGVTDLVGVDGRGLRRTVCWEGAVSYAREVLPALVGAPRGTVLNLNVPSAERAGIRGLRRAPLASFGAVQTNILESGRGYVQIGVSEVDASSEPDSDAALLIDGWATLTALRPVCQATDVDLSGLFSGEKALAG